MKKKKKKDQREEMQRTEQRLLCRLLQRLDGVDAGCPQLVELCLTNAVILQSIDICTSQLRTERRTKASDNHTAGCVRAKEKKKEWTNESWICLERRLAKRCTESDMPTVRV